MPLATYVPTKLKRSQVINAGPQLKFDTDTLIALLVVAGSGIPDTSKTGVQYIADVTATNAELSYSGYARQTLSGVTVAFDSTGTTIVDFSFSNITWAKNTNDPGTGRYLIIGDSSFGANDSGRPVVAVCDLNGLVSCAAGDLIFAAPTGGLIQWQ